MERSEARYHLGMTRLAMMHEEEIARFVREHFDPLPDFGRGPTYRAAVKLVDGVVLPCVAFSPKRPLVELAVKRLQETNFERRIVESFVAKRSCLDYWQIAEILPTRFAIPLERMHEIRGETRMSWTGFKVRMKDDATFNFGTTFDTMFFDMPEGYSGNDIVQITPHMEPREGHHYREKPYFTCYISGLELDPDPSTTAPSPTRVASARNDKSFWERLFTRFSRSSTQG